jgi:cytoskeletal protein RodZ
MSSKNPPLLVQPYLTIALCSAELRWKSRPSISSRGGFSVVTLNSWTLSIAEDMTTFRGSNHVGQDLQDLMDPMFRKCDFIVAGMVWVQIGRSILRRQRETSQGPSTTKVQERQQQQQPDPKKDQSTTAIEPTQKQTWASSRPTPSSAPSPSSTSAPPTSSSPRRASSSTKMLSSCWENQCAW